MLAVPADPHRGLPGDADAWAYEVAWDGMRVLVDIAEGTVRLSSYTGHDVTAAFPEFTGLGAHHPDALLDGEVVVLRDGVPSVVALADRMPARAPRHPRSPVRPVPAVPATFIAFDVLRLYGVDVTARAWQERRQVLERLGPSDHAWPLSPVYDDRDSLIAATVEHGLEGVVAKRRASRYAPGARTGDWVKLTHRRPARCLVGGGS